MSRRIDRSAVSSKVGARIRELQTERGMTLQELAEAGALSANYLASVEDGFATLTVETLDRIARALDVPPMRIIVFPEDDERDLIADLICKLPEHEHHKVRKDIEECMAQS
ncbi:helix-turn-helix domain-containing protein [Polyangium mundeleinium]|uniref:Helix-turn-helix domain-containing protein n=1 Tax=Polyangium mundeleinium TaxID=2995306 RepID=A0ABT5EVI6_9BACT|nr:helix-turn-helix domain-containing protein [Polyangium mundeleinium]MDC0745449.1 helix-turn-helix domain-containing protein [Polyangium mundeleinium]